MRQESTKTRHHSDIPDIEIIDLDQVTGDSLSDGDRFREKAPDKNEEEIYDVGAPYVENDELYGSVPSYEEEDELPGSVLPNEEEGELPVGGPSCEEYDEHYRGTPFCEEPDALYGGTPSCEEPDALYGGGTSCEEPDELYGDPSCEEPDELYGSAPSCEEPDELYGSGPSCEQDVSPCDDIPSREGRHRRSGRVSSSKRPDRKHNRPPSHRETAEEEEGEGASERSGGFFPPFILHILFVFILLLCVGLIIFRFSNWGTRVPSFFDPDADFDDNELIEVLDNMINVPADQRRDTDGVRTVVLLGNSPFSDLRDSEDSVVGLARSMTDAVFYNCSVADSHLAAARETFLAKEAPMDAFNLYWLSTLITLHNTDIYDSAFSAMGDAAPADARYAYETLSTLDFQNVDVLAIMYDASDYLEERPLYNPLNTTDIQTFAGNMDASLELIRNTFPHLRIIVMSPTYAYYVDENGEYISSDIHKSTGFSLSTYAGNLEQIAYLHSVSYLDNIYGTVNEENAEDYLEDNLHLNAAGRKKLAERFVYALEYFD